MSRFWHGVAQGGLVALSVGVSVVKFIPGPWQIGVVAASAVTQGILAIKHHKVPKLTQIPNPSGKVI